MPKTIEEIKSELLQLDRHSRATLASALLDSLDAVSDDDHEQLWIEEGETRYADFLAGKTSAIDGDEVLARARSRKR